MSRLRVLAVIFISSLLIGYMTYAKDSVKEHAEPEGHAHEEKGHDEDEAHSDHSHEEEAGKKAGEHDEHAEGEKHDDHDDEKDEEGHGHGESEKSGSVGPDKGITEANEKDGFKLSAEAIKNFELKTIDIGGSKIIKLSKSSIFFGLEEKNIYRLRNGFYKRVDFKTLSRSGSEFTLECKDLAPGDKLVVHGLGFLRIAEMAAFGGVATGHSH